MTWLSYHFRPLETQDIFLTRAFRPFLEQYIWPTQGARGFFLRYADESGPHLRLRLRGEEVWIEETLREAFAGWFEGRGEWEEVAYQPEPERFGGAEALAYAEEHFHLSTRVVLDRLRSEGFTYGDAMFDALRLHTILAFAAGFDFTRAAWYFGRLCEQWAPLYFLPADGAPLPHSFLSDLKKDFEQGYAPQSAALNETLRALWKALDEGKMDAKQPEWLRWLRGNELILKGFGDKLDRALPSLIHLTNNRLGINNQDEVYLNYILSRLPGF